MAILKLKEVNCCEITPAAPHPPQKKGQVTCKPQSILSVFVDMGSLDFNKC